MTMAERIDRTLPALTPEQQLRLRHLAEAEPEISDLVKKLLADCPGDVSAEELLRALEGGGDSRAPGLKALLKDPWMDEDCREVLGCCARMGEAGLDWQVLTIALPRREGTLKKLLGRGWLILTEDGVVLVPESLKALVREEITAPGLLREFYRNLDNLLERECHGVCTLEMGRVTWRPALLEPDAFARLARTFGEGGVEAGEEAVFAQALALALGGSKRQARLLADQALKRLETGQFPGERQIRGYRSAFRVYEHLDWDISLELLAKEEALFLRTDGPETQERFRQGARLYARLCRMACNKLRSGLRWKQHWMEKLQAWGGKALHYGGRMFPSDPMLMSMIHGSMADGFWLALCKGADVMEFFISGPGTYRMLRRTGAENHETMLSHRRLSLNYARQVTPVNHSWLSCIHQRMADAVYGEESQEHLQLALKFREDAVIAREDSERAMGENLAQLYLRQGDTGTATDYALGHGKQAPQEKAWYDKVLAYFMLRLAVFRDAFEDWLGGEKTMLRMLKVLLLALYQYLLMVAAAAALLVKIPVLIREGRRDRG